LIWCFSEPYPARKPQPRNWIGSFWDLYIP